MRSFWADDLPEPFFLPLRRGDSNSSEVRGEEGICFWATGVEGACVGAARRVATCKGGCWWWCRLGRWGEAGPECCTERRLRDPPSSGPLGAAGGRWATEVTGDACGLGRTSFEEDALSGLPRDLFGVPALEKPLSETSCTSTSSSSGWWCWRGWSKAGESSRRTSICSDLTTDESEGSPWGPTVTVRMWESSAGPEGSRVSFRSRLLVTKAKSEENAIRGGSVEGGSRPGSCHVVLFISQLLLQRLWETRSERRGR